MSRIDRREYVQLYGPTTGDQIRLADTDLWIEIEEDRTFGGDEATFGGGKTIRESMGQGMTLRSEGALDVVITNAVVLDHWGIVRADVGIRDGRIVAVDKAGNSDVMDGIRPDMQIGPATDVISGEGKILTAGAVDTHVHFLSEIEMREALATGTTTVIGGGTGPTEGSKATTVTAGAWSLAMMHRALDHIPLNVILFGKGSTVSHGALREDALAGAGGYKVHEDWGATPAAIDAALRAADEFGLQVALHADSLNETGYVQAHPRCHRRARHPRIPHGRRRRWSRTRHHRRGRRIERDPGVDEPDASLHRQHCRRTSRYAPGRLTTSIRGCPRTLHSRSRGSERRRWRRKISCRTWARSRSRRPTRRRWVASAN